MNNIEKCADESQSKLQMMLFYETYIIKKCILDFRNRLYIPIQSQDSVWESVACNNITLQKSYTKSNT